SFRLVAGNRHLHRHYKFAVSVGKTVALSLRHSCRSELTRQGISLSSSYSVSREAGLYLSHPVFMVAAISRIFEIPAIDKCSLLLISSRIFRNLIKSTRFFDLSWCSSKKERSFGSGDPDSGRDMPFVQRDPFEPRHTQKI